MNFDRVSVDIRPTNLPNGRRGDEIVNDSSRSIDNRTSHWSITVALESLGEDVDKRLQQLKWN